MQSRSRHSAVVWSGEVAQLGASSRHVLVGGDIGDWTVAEVDEAAQAAHDLGGRVTEHYVTPLIVLMRAESGQVPT